MLNLSYKLKKVIVCTCDTILESVKESNIVFLCLDGTYCFDAQEAKNRDLAYLTTTNRKDY